MLSVFIFLIFIIHYAYRTKFHSLNSFHITHISDFPFIYRIISMRHILQLLRLYIILMQFPCRIFFITAFLQFLLHSAMIIFPINFQYTTGNVNKFTATTKCQTFASSHSIYIHFPDRHPCEVYAYIF